MKIILAPDSFKGSMSSAEAAAAMKRGILRIIPSADLVTIPMADGGEGTVSAVLDALDGKEITVPVHGPMGTLTNAVYAILNDGTAIIEMAQASGITLISPSERNPMEASSFGTGELILSALSHGCKKIYIGIGGSATNDGGMGLAEALGVRFYDSQGRILTGKGSSLNQVDRIDPSGLDVRLEETEIVVLCDVWNPLCGPNGASIVFAPQKGASQEEVEHFEEGMCHYASKLQEYTGLNIAKMPGAGAAGGLGAGLFAFCKAKPLKGCETILDILEFDRLLENADFVITGEGRIDQSTALGKVPYSIAARAAKYKIPVIAIGGSVCRLSVIRENPLFIAESAVTEIMLLDEAIEHSSLLLESAAARVMQLIQLGMNLQSLR